MTEAGYPPQAGQEQKHRALTATVEENAGEVLKGRTTISLRILQFLKD
jgi:hypothetical protein